MRNNLLSHHRHTVKSVIARKTSNDSALFVDIRFDAYKLHAVSTPWPRKSASANSTQFNTLTLASKKLVNMGDLCESAVRTAARPNDSISKPTSMNIRARSRILRKISWILVTMVREA